MNIIKNNTRVIGLCGSNAIIGKVLTSRHYGSKLLYTVILETPLSFRWRPDPITTVLLSDNDLIAAPL